MTKKLAKSIIVAFAVLFLNCFSIQAESLNTKGDVFTRQAEVEQYIQTAIYNFWYGNEIKANESKIFKGITLRGKMGVVEFNYAKAAELAPYRLDLKFDLASTQILQGKVKEALDTYKLILNLDRNNFNANLLFAVYNKVIGNKDIYEKQISELEKLYPEKTKLYIKVINDTDNNFSLKLNTESQKLSTENNVIVILGYALADDGTAQPTLIERLKQGLAAYKLNPKSKIIVTGGMPHGGITESFVMQQWLMQNGVTKDKIYLEDQSKDTVGNAFFAVKIIEKLNPENIILITSASHMRRAYSVFQAALLQENLNIPISNLVYLDYKSLDEAMNVSEQEKLVVFRDVLRGAGIWAYPGIQQ